MQSRSQLFSKEEQAYRLRLKKRKHNAAIVVVIVIVVVVVAVVVVAVVVALVEPVSKLSNCETKRKSCCRNDCSPSGVPTAAS